MGDFFQRFANWLTGKNIECYKINFNAGDRYFYRSMKNVFDYKGQPNIFSEWLKDFGGVSKSMLRLNEAIIDIKEG